MKPIILIDAHEQTLSRYVGRECTSKIKVVAYAQYVDAQFIEMYRSDPARFRGEYLAEEKGVA